MAAATVAASLPPGPRAPAAVLLGRMIGTRQLAALVRWRREYGPVFTLNLPGGRLVLLSRPEDLRTLYRSDKEHGLPRARDLALGPVLGPRSLLRLEGATHRERRRLLAPPLHGRRMRVYEQTIRDVVATNVATWPVGTPFPLHPRMQAIALEVIIQAVFGVRGPRADTLRAALIELLDRGRTTRGAVEAIASMQLPGPAGRSLPFARAVTHVRGLLAEEIADRRRADDAGDRDDILSLMLDVRDEDGQGLDDEELVDQLLTLLAAGHETTATALAWAFDALFAHPAVHERLRAAAAAGDDAYPAAVAQETLRIRPVVPLAGRKLGVTMTTSTGHELAAGTGVVAAIALAHLDPDTFPEPLAFRPERFLHGPVDLFAWVPFGGGVRRCIGAAFAQMELRVALSSLAALDLRPAEGPQRIVGRGVTLQPEHGTPAVLVSRPRAATVAA